MSQVGTNALFQYDDIDGYRYVVFDFWKTIAYRVRICKLPNNNARDAKSLFFELYLYHVDGSKSKTAFGAVPLDMNKKPSFYTIRSQDIKVDLWRVFVEHIEKIMSTMVLSIHTLKREVDLLASRLKKYDASKSFNQNLPIILNLDSDTITRTQEDKTTFLTSLVEMDRENRLSECLWNGISLFYEIYENEMRLVQPDK